MSRAVAPDSFRLRPPAIRVPAAAGWVLRAAFGAPVDEPPADSAPREAAVWAARLGLLERIGAHGEPGRLSRQLGDERAGVFVSAARRTAATNLLLRELAATAVGAADERGIPVLLLKGMALLEEIDDLDAARPLADVDLLVEDGAGRELSLALEAAGFTRSPIHESSQHLPALHLHFPATTEIYTQLPGLGTEKDRRTSATTILAAGLHHPAPELAPAQVPARRILVAHAIAHALVQNANAPTATPCLRMVADLEDLGSGHRPVAELVGLASAWLTGHVSRRELDAVTALCQDLASGAAPENGSDAKRILDHALAIHLDPGYRRALKLRALSAVVRRGDWLKIRRRAELAVSDRARQPARGLRRAFRVGWSRLSRRSGRGGESSVL